MKNKIVMALLALFMAQAAYAGPGLNLPDSAHMCLAHPYSDISYWKVTFDGIGAGYDLENKAYPGWCADSQHTISGCNTCSLYSIADNEPLPSYAESDNWDLIGYMIDGYRDDKPGWSCLTMYEIQHLVWMYLGDTYSWGSPSKSCMATVSAAVNASGEGFVPDAGDTALVLCDTAQGEKQLIFIELPLPAPEIASALAAIALVSPAFGYLLIKRKD